MTDDIAKIADHPKWAYKVSATVFLPETKQTSVKLKKGERLFVLTDKGVEDSGCSGPEDILIITEHFGVWPVVAIKVREAHADAWRDLPKDVHLSMMKRVRTHLEKDGRPWL